MEASMLGVLAYVSPQEIPLGWPVPPAHYDRKIGRRSLHNGLEQAEFADQLGFDWVSVSEHHYSTMSVAPHPALTAAAVVNRVRRARIAMLGHVLPLYSPVRVAEELGILDNLCDGRLVVGFLRGTPNEYQSYGVNPAETRERMVEGMELILKAWTEPQPFGWEGRYYQYRTVSVWPRPLQEPYPRTYMLGPAASRRSSPPPIVSGSVSRSIASSSSPGIIIIIWRSAPRPDGSPGQPMCSTAVRSTSPRAMSAQWKKGCRTGAADASRSISS